MSEFHVKVVRVGEIEKNPNADRLWVTKVPGTEYTVQFTTDEAYQPGDLAVYVPFDSVVPCDDPRWSYLNGKTHPVMDPPGYRIRAMRLKGIFSTGVYTKPLPGMQEGDDAAEALRIRKYEPPEDLEAGVDDERDPGFLPTYTDIVGLRAHPDALTAGEEVILTEKIHGENGRFLWKNDRLWIASRTRCKKLDSGTRWAMVARELDFAKRLAAVPDVVIYGEVCGNAKGFQYGTGKKGGCRFLMFDACNANSRQFFDYDDVVALARQLGLTMVPELYRGPWSTDLFRFADGNTTIPGAGHIREGFVVRPVKERYDPKIGRVILKRHGEQFLLKH
jgi:RNA ligase (TIGR02306 family)